MDFQPESASSLPSTGSSTFPSSFSKHGSGHSKLESFHGFSLSEVDASKYPTPFPASLPSAPTVLVRGNEFITLKSSLKNPAMGDFSVINGSQGSHSSQPTMVASNKAVSREVCNTARKPGDVSLNSRLDEIMQHITLQKRSLMGDGEITSDQIIDSTANSGLTSHDSRITSNVTEDHMQPIIQSSLKVMNIDAHAPEAAAISLQGKKSLSTAVGQIPTVIPSQSATPLIATEDPCHIFPSQNQFLPYRELSTFPSKDAIDSIDFKFPETLDFPPLPSAPIPGKQHTLSSDSAGGSSWAHLFSSNRLKENGLSLEFIPPSSHTSTIEFSHEEVEPELARWQHALVGYVLGMKPPFKMMKQYVDNRWKIFGAIDLYVLDSGVFIFKFQDAEMKQKALDMGPWTYSNRPLLLMPWSPDSSYELAGVTNLPIWIRLP